MRYSWCTFNIYFGKLEILVDNVPAEYKYFNDYECLMMIANCLNSALWRMPSLMIWCSALQWKMGGSALWLTCGLVIWTGLSRCRLWGYVVSTDCCTPWPGKNAQCASVLGSSVMRIPLWGVGVALIPRGWFTQLCVIISACVIVGHSCWRSFRPLCLAFVAVAIFLLLLCFQVFTRCAAVLPGDPSRPSGLRILVKELGTAWVSRGWSEVERLRPGAMSGLEVFIVATLFLF